MSFKETRQGEKFKKKTRRGFRGYPIATIAYYGPSDKRASKVVVAIVGAESAEPEPMQKWFSETGDVRNDLEINEEIFHFIESNVTKSIVVTDRIIGCPHEEGIDYPEGEKYPQCPFWAHRDRGSGKFVR